MDENKISRLIVDSAIEVHRALGEPGWLEAVYEESLVDTMNFDSMRCAFASSRPCVKIDPALEPI